MADTEFEFVADPDAPNNGPMVNAVCWSLFGFCTVFVALRGYCKFKRHRGLWWDDYVLLASWVSFLVAVIQLSVNIHYGFGKPGLQIDPAYSYKVGMGGLITGMFIMIAPMLSKISFILTLSRISGPKLKIGLWVIAATMCLFQAGAIIVQWAQCTPIEKVWQPWLPEGTCWPFEVNLAMSMGAAAYSGVCDLVLAIIPWIVLKDLQMKKKEKIGIAAAMSLGVVAAATAFAKCAKLKLLISSDFTLEGGELIIWASTEISTTIVAACIPVLRTLVKDLSTRGVSGPSGGYFRSTAGDGSRRRTKNGTHVTISDRDGQKMGHSGGVSPDEASDKSILYSGKITKTEEVIVNFSDRGDGMYEMNHMPGGAQDRSFG